MRIFLTGATGYVGSALARRLSRDGHTLAALVRETSETASLDELGVRTFVGDVTDRYSMREPMSGADWVIHAAADLDFAAAPERMRQINAVGSENVASLASKLGVGRLLSVSSIAIFGGSPSDGSAATEESAPELPFPSAYSAHNSSSCSVVSAQGNSSRSKMYSSSMVKSGSVSRIESANASRCRTRLR